MQGSHSNVQEVHNEAGRSAEISSVGRGQRSTYGIYTTRTCTSWQINFVTLERKRGRGRGRGTKKEGGRKREGRTKEREGERKREGKRKGEQRMRERKWEREGGSRGERDTHTDRETQRVTCLSLNLQEVGVDRQSHLNLRQVPEDLLPALESHLSEMDAIKKTANAQPRSARPHPPVLHTCTCICICIFEWCSSS